ncbi:hypothetical protein D3C71_718460 [compost metagenome]
MVVAAGRTLVPPLVACSPVQPPLAAHVTVFSVVHAKMLLPPMSMASGWAVNARMRGGSGGGGGVVVGFNPSIKSCAKPSPPASKYSMRTV